LLHYKTYIKSETAEWVIFIHGAGGSSNIWFKQIKAFKPHFNLLLVDLRGHGGSAAVSDKWGRRDYTFESISAEIIEVVEHLKLPASHWVGVSLGTIIIRHIAEQFPNYTKSLILIGAISRLNFKSRFWVGLGRTFKNVLPYMWLYRFFAFIIMPKNNHKESRHVFINEAKRLCHKEFLRWYQLTGQMTGLFRRLDKPKNPLPSLYVMGEFDHLFLQPIKELVSHTENAVLHVVQECGHVVNIEKPIAFNTVAIDYLLGLRR
jgi:pimeloyl-ACP methyl ester carboxylesterase